MSETLTIKIEINGVVYPVSCISGEEDRLSGQKRSKSSYRRFIKHFRNCWRN